MYGGIENKVGPWTFGVRLANSITALDTFHRTLQNSFYFASSTVFVGFYFTIILIGRFCDLLSVLIQSFHSLIIQCTFE